MPREEKPISRKKVLVSVEIRYLTEAEDKGFTNISQYIDFLRNEINIIATKKQAQYEIVVGQLNEANAEILRLKGGNE